MFQNRRSGSVAPNDVPIDVPVSPDNRFNYNGRIQKLGHCNQNTACIAQLSCSDTPFDHGTNCANDAWPDHSLGRKVAWSFNINSGKCQSFGYGGCDGSLNTFQTRIECENCKLINTSKEIDRYYIYVQPLLVQTIYNNTC